MCFLAMQQECEAPVQNRQMAKCFRKSRMNRKGNRKERDE